MGIDKNLNYNNIVEQILELDKFITSIVIANMKDGKIIATKYRESVPTLLTREESELSVIQSLISTSMAKTREHKLGKMVYFSMVYENERRASMYLCNNNERGSKQDNSSDPILMISFDKNAEHERIINSKILPFLKEIDTLR